MTGPAPSGGAPAAGPAPRRRLIMWISLGVAALLAALVAVLASSSQAGQSTSRSQLIGKPAPAVSGPDQSGKTVTVASYRGRWLLVNFAASWCGPCREETPQLIAFADRHTGPGAPAIITIEEDETDLASLRRFLADRHATWPVVDDTNAFVDYGSQGLPESYLVDPVGTIVAKVTGGVNADALDKLIATYSAPGS